MARPIGWEADVLATELAATIRYLQQTQDGQRRADVNTLEAQFKQIVAQYRKELIAKEQAKRIKAMNKKSIATIQSNAKQL